jgi:arylsulfatase
MYYCPGAGHSPHHVEPEWIERYKGKFDKGWDKWREEVFERQLQSGIVPPGTKLPLRPIEIKAWDDLHDDARRLYARQMEVFAAFLEQTDHHLGRVVDFLDQLDELENTLIILASDNGASAEGGEHGSFNECLFPNRVEPGVEENLERIDDWGGAKSYPNYAWGWAWAGNTPLRRWKRYLHQGGMSDPLVVHWPKGVSAKGDIRHQYIHAIDIVPTVLEILDISAPATLNGVAQRPIEGVSFAHTMNEPDASTKKEAQYYEMIGSRAIWMDGWKAVAEQKQGSELTEEELANQRWELYHVADDFSESENLADRHPDRLKAMVERWWLEAGKHNVLPLDSRMQSRMADRKPSTASCGTRYVYYPGGAPHFEYTAVNVKNRSHTITAEVIVPKEGAEGVLLAHGSWFAGYSLYVKDGLLVYVHNYLGLVEYRIRSNETLSVGRQILRFEFVRTGEHQGMGILYANGREIGRGVIGKTIPAVIETSGEGLCCGFDSGLPVTADYRAPFRFTGTLSRVVVEIEEDGKREPPDADINFVAALINQ